MKKIAITLLMALTMASSYASEAEWLTDITQAQAKAKTENKLVLMNFTGSDWCEPCKVLHKNVFSSQVFTDFAKANLVLVEADFPLKKEQSKELKDSNDALRKKFDVEGFPTIIVLRPDGKELLRENGYDGSDAKKYAERIGKLKK